MSYRLLIKSLPATLRSVLRQPTCIAGIASVGIHGLFWVVLPILPLNSSESQEAEIQHPVSLVELSPTEQSRLPDFSTPPITLPSQSDLYSLSPGANSLPSIPSQPPLQPYPDLRSLFGALPPPPPLTSLPWQTIPRPSSSPRSRVRPSITPSPTTSQPSPSPSPSPDRISSGGTVNSPDLDRLARDTATTNPQPSPGANPGSQASPRAIARALEDQQRLQDQYRALFSFNDAGTRPRDGDLQAGQWFYTELRVPGNVDMRDEVPNIPISLPFPIEACRLPLERPVVGFGVLVDTDGKVVGQPRMLQSSGYGIFNQKGLEGVKQHTFNQESPSEPYLIGENRVYLVMVRFDGRQTTCLSTPAPASPAAN